ncbi:MAG: TRAP transporter permease [Atribacterota bacterium]|nr:TRAP transporter permease [Atribacterota bacterium]MDD5497257.1 TRAP transporter permease [Atribacterota bacterium]
MKDNIDKENESKKNITELTEAHEKIDVQKLLEQYDTESNIRRPIGYIAIIISIIAISMSLFHFYTGGFGLWLALKQRALHLAFTLALIFLLYPTTKKGIGSDKSKVPLWDIVLATLGAFTSLYLIIYYNELVFRAGLPSRIDLIMGGITILLVLEATRRAIGPELPIVVVVFLIYAYFGPYMPGFLAHRGYSLERIIEHLYMQTEGIYGIPLGVSSSFVFLFILFGSVLNKTGMGKFFIDLSMALAGHTTGGPAKVAVIASGFMGSINGSSVANVVTTGSFTIPLMKSIGYKKDFAGAVEAAASTGGQIMPPVMGAAAFVMSEFLEIPYIKIAAAAIIPAIIYYIAVITMVHLEACKYDLKGLPKERLPKAKEVLQEKGHLLVPIIGLVYLLVRGYTALFAAFWAIVMSLAVSMLKKETRLNLKGLLGAFEDGAKGALGVAAACACAGMVVGVVTLTGLGLKIANGIVSLGGGNLLLTLFFTMIASILLGMGLPTTAKYIILSIMAAPALIQLGVLPLAAHMFILYFGVIADLTPPVAVAAFAGAGIAGGNTMRTGFISVRLAVAGFMIPYIFAINPALMGLGGSFIQTIQLVITSLAGVLSLGAAAGGYLLVKTPFYERILLLISAILLISPDLMTDIIGIIILMTILFLQHTRQKKQKTS